MLIPSLTKLTSGTKADSSFTESGSDGTALSDWRFPGFAQSAGISIVSYRQYVQVSPTHLSTAQDAHDVSTGQGVGGGEALNCRGCTLKRPAAGPHLPEESRLLVSFKSGRRTCRVTQAICNCSCYCAGHHLHCNRSFSCSGSSSGGGKGTSSSL